MAQLKNVKRYTASHPNMGSMKSLGGPMTRDKVAVTETRPSTKQLRPASRGVAK